MVTRLAKGSVVPLALAAVSILVVVVLLSIPAQVPARLTAYTLGADERQLLVTVVMLRSDSIASLSAKQDAESIHVIVMLDRRRGVYPSDEFFVDVRVQLATPLAARSVFDGAGNPLPLRAR